ncbi:hypothetical protein PGT21_000410 [Puccinia graminis f. sp. tritici]|uniref:Uncharacterized protein n=1 Tax=Puccinia graminis f. sp. tritici TaxID=56615 RepID=A0A5B0LIG7_PUCGR|nr:hypothetical protein PGT21_000410 [Puccinia graminis f. sp. tritici]
MSTAIHLLASTFPSDLHQGEYGPVLGSQSDRPTFNFRDQNQHHRRLQGDQQASKASKAINRRLSKANRLCSYFRNGRGFKVIPLALPLFILIIRRDQY